MIYTTPTIYIAGPYTLPDPCENVHKAVKAADALLRMGYAPYVPHLTHFWHTMYPHPYETWMGLDLPFVAKCDYLVRLPGVSAGADREVSLALNLGKPVFYGMEAVPNLSGE